MKYMVSIYRALFFKKHRLRFGENELWFYSLDIQIYLLGFGVLGIWDLYKYLLKSCLDA